MQDGCLDMRPPTQEATRLCALRPDHMEESLCNRIYTPAQEAMLSTPPTQIPPDQERGETAWSACSFLCRLATSNKIWIRRI